jgi:hypothetical protein
MEKSADYRALAILASRAGRAEEQKAMNKCAREFLLPNLSTAEQAEYDRLIKAKRAWRDNVFESKNAVN